MVDETENTIFDLIEAIKATYTTNEMTSKLPITTLRYLLIVFGL
jgi:hypothetical protein